MVLHDCRLGRVGGDDGKHLFPDSPPATPPLGIPRLFNRLPLPCSGSVRLCYKNARFVTSGHRAETTSMLTLPISSRPS
jgi:hypothetical protein